MPKKKPTTWTRDDFRSHLGEGFHTAFRKAVDGHPGSLIHSLIRDLPEEQWAAVLDFVSSGFGPDEFIVGKE